MRCPTERNPIGALLAGTVLAVAACAASLSAQERKQEGARAAAGVKVLDVSFPREAARNLPERGGWLPCYLELEAAGGKAERVLVEATMGDDKRVVYTTREWIEVAPGAPRRAWIYLRADPRDGSRQVANLEVRTADGAILRRDGPWDVGLALRQSNRVSLLVVWENAGGDDTPWPGSLPDEGGQSIEEAVESLSALKLPDSVLGYHGFDLVVLRDLGSSRLEPAQVDALCAWARLGGFVVLAPAGNSDAIFRSEVARRLLGEAIDGEAARAEPGFMPRKLFLVDRITRAGLPRPFPDEEAKLFGPANLDYTVFHPLKTPFPVEIVASSEEGSLGLEPGVRRIFALTPCGLGRVGLLLLDDQLHRSVQTQKFLNALWAKVLSLRPRPRDSSFLEHAAQSLPGDIVERYLKDTSREVGTGVMVGLISGYLILVGPVLYFFLKRLNRLPSVIWVEPLFVVLYLGVMFATAYITKGVFTKTRLLTFISQREGEPDALRASFLSIFSASQAVYRITAPPDGLLLQPIFQNKEEAQSLVVSRAPSGEVAIEELKLAHWQEGHVLNAGFLELEGDGIELSEVEGAEPRRVAVTNRLPFPVREGYYYEVSGGKCYAVPAIEPGKRVEIELSRAAEDDKIQTRKELAARGLGYGGQIRLAALLERKEADFRVDQRTSLKERADWYILYRAE